MDFLHQVFEEGMLIYFVHPHVYARLHLNGIAFTKNSTKFLNMLLKFILNNSLGNYIGYTGAERGVHLSRIRSKTSLVKWKIIVKSGRKIWKNS